MTVSLSQALLNILVVTIADLDISYSEIIDCSEQRSDELCVLRCDHIDICKDSTLNCRSNSPCLIECIEDSSCMTSHINSKLATDVTVICSQRESCKGMKNLTCGTGNCIIQCNDSTSCSDFEDVDISNAKSFECIADDYTHCPHTITHSNNAILSSLSSIESMDSIEIIQSINTMEIPMPEITKMSTTTAITTSIMDDKFILTDHDESMENDNTIALEVKCESTKSNNHERIGHIATNSMDMISVNDTKIIDNGSFLSSSSDQLWFIFAMIAILLCVLVAIICFVLIKTKKYMDSQRDKIMKLERFRIETQSKISMNEYQFDGDNEENKEENGHSMEYNDLFWRHFKSVHELSVTHQSMTDLSTINRSISDQSIIEDDEMEKNDEGFECYPNIENDEFVIEGHDEEGSNETLQDHIIHIPMENQEKRHLSFEITAVLDDNSDYSYDSNTIC